LVKFSPFWYATPTAPIWQPCLQTKPWFPESSRTEVQINPKNAMILALAPRSNLRFGFADDSV
jgi:hypothetical protein